MKDQATTGLAAAAGWDAAVQSASDRLIAGALGDDGIEALFGGLCERLAAAGLPLWRAHVGVSTLHPMFEAMTCTWYRSRGARTTSYRRGERDRSQWRQSPHRHMIEAKTRAMRRRLEGAEATLDFPVLAEFRAEGATDYLALVTPFGEGPEALARLDGMVTSWVTDAKGGFGEEHVAALMRLEPRLGVAIKLRVREQTAINVVSAYLGPGAGRRVLDGAIRRGDGEVIHAALWYSDMRGSTALAERLPAPEFLSALNAYFECTAGAVLDHGGEVLRFIGDAVLAIFPIEGPGGEARATRAALAASADAEARLAKVNAKRERAGVGALGFGLGLHEGEVMFGNIGVPERLEFSVIGAAANEVARIEGVTKEIGRTVVVSAAFARHLALAWEPLGSFSLRGVSGALEVFAPPPSPYPLPPLGGEG